MSLICSTRIHPIHITKAWELRAGLGNPNTPLQAGTFCDVSFGCFIQRKLRRDSRSRKSGLGKGVWLRYISSYSWLKFSIIFSQLPFGLVFFGTSGSLGYRQHRSLLFYKYLMTRGDSRVPGCLSPSRVESGATKLSLHGGLRSFSSFRMDWGATASLVFVYSLQDFDKRLASMNWTGASKDGFKRLADWPNSCRNQMAIWDADGALSRVQASLINCHGARVVPSAPLRTQGHFYGSYDNLSNDVWPLEKEPCVTRSYRNGFEIHKFNARVNGKREHQEDYIMRRLISSAFARWFRP
ncbi:hypothetical protein BGY98DRAFT_1125080 [Russula aff. rugulosa BPL654]|nr:hypothetical protein BGY98DRAFT_1125080 [Russula aff. rugulosa BPL654]